MIKEEILQEISQILGNSINQHNLLGGDLSKILFSSYLYLKNKNENTNAFQLIENAFENENITDIDELGSIWLIQHLIKIGILDKDSADIIEDLTNSLPALIELDEINKNYELLYGMAGKAICYFESLPNFITTQKLASMAKKLRQIAIEDNNGISWLDLKEKERTINLGISHGIPAVIATLAKIFTFTGEGKETIEKSVGYLLAQKKKDSILDDYPQVIGENIKKELCRLAWCYGDLGIALALFHASKALNREDWKQEAINTALKATKRTPENSTIVYNKEFGIFDAGFCHGTSGVAHIFNRFYKATKIQDFKVAADFWLQKTLQARLPNGKWLFPHHNYKTNEKDWLENNSLLEGLAGVGLVLLGFYDENTEPAWDSMFLTDI